MKKGKKKAKKGRKIHDVREENIDKKGRERKRWRRKMEIWDFLKSFASPLDTLLS